MNFDELRKFIANEYKCFDIDINNRGKKYHFCQLLPTESYNPDLFSISRNHYFCYRDFDQKYKSSKFHDPEDVDVEIWRDEFISANLSPPIKINDYYLISISLITKTFTATISTLSFCKK